MKESTYDKNEERFVIMGTYTVIYPNTVMIENCSTSVTYFAMLTFHSTKTVAILAVVMVSKIYIEFYVFIMF